jgi:hypothetical protein
MSDEPNFQNHHHQQHEGLDNIGGMQAMPSPEFPEFEALAARLTADGAVWQSRLPDPTRVAERIRAIPGESLAFPRRAAEGDFPMSIETNDTNTPGSPRWLRTPTSANPPRPPRSGKPRGRWLGLIAAVVVVALLALVLGLLARGRTGGSPAAQSTQTSTTQQTQPAQTSTTGAFQVTSVAMSVSPTSIANLACGSSVTVTYTATIQVANSSSGGTVQFTYTVNNGRQQTPASVTFNPGETSKTYTFTWSGALPADHTAPGLGGIQVTSPNQLTSSMIAPTGQCVTAPACGSNFSGRPYQSTLTTAYGTVPLPTLSRTVPNDASGGQRGYDICSAGTAASIAAYMEQNLPSYGWTLVSSSGGIETWKSSTGTINWSVTDPLNWNINWRVPLA